MSSMMPLPTGAVSSPVVSSTTTSEVREILRQISGQEVWEDRNIWLYFLVLLLPAVQLLLSNCL